jgi:hypothetical protein
MQTDQGGTLHEPLDQKNRPNYEVYCRLFYDIVPMKVCSLRRRELATSGWNTCSGCIVGLLHSWYGNSAGR